MADVNLEKVMDGEWESVREGFYYPQLPKPRLVNNIPNGSIDMKSLSIKVSEPFIRGFKEYEIKEEDALNEVLTHELTHYMKYPGSVLNTLRLQKAAREVTDSEKANQLRTAFTETQTNIYMVSEKKHPTTVRMRKAVQPDQQDALGRLMYGLYQEVWGEDLGIDLGKEERSLIDKLKGIDFLDKSKEQYNIKKFVDILKDYEPPKQEGQDGQGEGEGNQQEQCQSNGLDMFNDNQIREGIRQFAQECNDPNEFEQIVGEVLSESKEEGDKEKIPVSSQGIMPGTDKGVLTLARNFYTALAQNYTVPVRKKPLHKNGSLYPHSHTEFSIGDSIDNLDPFSSPGILPGVTKKWVKKEGEVTTECESVPDSIIAIDNSGSMPNPDEGISIPVLGATAISNAYLENDSRVAVYSFGGQDNFMNLTRDKEMAHKALRMYTGGGTTFNAQFLENILKGSEEEFDISVVSDMAISNLDGFIQTVLQIPKVHRIHLVYTNNDGIEYVNQLKKEFENQENVAIVPMLQEKDIEKIVMGELKKSVR
jgi:hypothetical protein